MAFNGARDDSDSDSGISWTICKSFAPRFRQITIPARTLSLIFYRPDALPDDQPTMSKHQRQWSQLMWSN